MDNKIKIKYNQEHVTDTNLDLTWQEREQLNKLEESLHKNYFLFIQYIWSH